MLTRISAWQCHQIRPESTLDGSCLVPFIAMLRVYKKSGSQITKLFLTNSNNV
jgi:hypothetical protein